MGLMDRVERGGLHSNVSWHPLDDRWYGPISGPTAAGFAVSPSTAQRVSAVFACNSLILETVASLPCILYRRLANGGKERATDHRLYRTVRSQPNPWMTAMDFYGYGQGHLGLRGTFVSEIQESRGRIDLIPLHPDEVTLEQLPNHRVRVIHRPPKGRERSLGQDECLIVRDTSADGLVGMARATLAREAIAVAGAAEGFVGGFFKNDATGRLLVKATTPLTPEKRADVRAMIQENYAGFQNRSKAMLLSHGLEATELGGQQDSGFLVDPRKFQVADIARFWRVPGFMIGLEEKSTSWGTGIEQQKQGFVDFTIRPWLVRWEQALDRDLLLPEEQEEFFFEFLLDGLLRGDIQTTVDALATELEHGALSRNEWRIIRNRNPVPGGDEFQQQLPGTAANERPGAPPADDEDEQARAIPAPLLSDAASRIAHGDVSAVANRADKAKADGLKFVAWVHKFAADQKASTVRVLTPLAESYGFPAFAVSESAARVERTMVEALSVEGVPDGWLEQRKAEVFQVLDETFRAAAAMRRQEAA